MDTKDPFNETAIKILLDTSIASYNDERNRTKTIDGKSSISLPIISAFALTVVHAMKYKQIVALPATPFSKWIIPFVLFASYSVSLFFILLSVFFMTRVIIMHKYSTLNPEELFDEDYLTEESSNPYSMEIAQRYAIASTNNKVQNDQRVGWYRFGWKTAFVSLICYIVYYVFQTIFIA